MCSSYALSYVVRPNPNRQTGACVPALVWVVLQGRLPVTLAPSPPNWAKLLAARCLGHGVRNIDVISVRVFISFYTFPMFTCKWNPITNEIKELFLKLDCI